MDWVSISLIKLIKASEGSFSWAPVWTPLKIQRAWSDFQGLLMSCLDLILQAVDWAVWSFRELGLSIDDDYWAVWRFGGSDAVFVYLIKPIKASEDLVRLTSWLTEPSEASAWLVQPSGRCNSGSSRGLGSSLEFSYWALWGSRGLNEGLFPLLSKPSEDSEAQMGYQYLLSSPWILWWDLLQCLFCL